MGYRIIFRGSCSTPTPLSAIYNHFSSLPSHERPSALRENPEKQEHWGLPPTGVHCCSQMLLPEKYILLFYIVFFTPKKDIPTPDHSENFFSFYKVVIFQVEPWNGLKRKPVEYQIFYSPNCSVIQCNNWVFGSSINARNMDKSS